MGCDGLGLRCPRGEGKGVVRGRTALLAGAILANGVYFSSFARCYLRVDREWGEVFFGVGCELVRYEG